MIPNYLRHGSFRALARYLVTGRGGDTPERVAWLSYRNIDPAMPWQVATAIFESTVRTSRRRCKDPTLHFMWSPSPRDRTLTQDEWETIADRTLTTMGLEGHQAIIVEHNDTSFQGRPRPHLHMMVNAVNEDGGAWRRPILKPDPRRKTYETAPGDSFWKTRLDRLARELERDYGLEEIDTPISAYWEGRTWGRGRTRNRAEREIDQRTKRQPELPLDQDGVKSLAAAARPIIVAARSWDDLQGRLMQELGVTLCPKGQGLILRQADGHYAKLSALGKVTLAGQGGSTRLSKARLSRHLGEAWDDYWQRCEGQVAAREEGLRAGSALTPPAKPVPRPAAVGEAEATDDARDPAAAPMRATVEATVGPRQPVPIARTAFQQSSPPFDADVVATDDLVEADALPVSELFSQEDLARFKARMAGPVSASRSWARLEHLARMNGLRLHGGWTMHDGVRYFPVRLLDGFDLKERSRRYGESYEAYRQRGRDTRRLVPPTPGRSRDYGQER